MSGALDYVFKAVYNDKAVYKHYPCYVPHGGLLCLIREVDLIGISYRDLTLCNFGSWFTVHERFFLLYLVLQPEVIKTGIQEGKHGQAVTSDDEVETLRAHWSQ